MYKILFRKDYYSEPEFKVAKYYFDVVELRSLCENNLVIPRYSALPYYKELEQDLLNRNCKLINTLRQHNWIAQFEYYEALREYTPETWWRLTDTDYDGPMVVKGVTNSRKYQWNTHMYAANRREAMRVSSHLYNDGLIGTQDLIFRKYVPLKTFETLINGTPCANEWRFFCLGNKILSYGYYWSSADKPELAYINEQGISLAQTVADIAAEYVNFFVMDIAETVEGKWILIELNDGSMSGLSENDPHVLYSALTQELPQWLSNRQNY
jgi:hypothetical protein